MKKIAVLTGAGISTSAGIPDFRGPDGVWTKHPDQMQVYDIDAFMKDKEAREFSWRWQKESPVWNAKCTKAHFALAELEKAGGLGVLATQNFDGLHEKAGSRNVVDLHGTILTSHCMKCGKKYDTKEIMKNLDEEPDPRCEKCGGILKTDVVYFGEPLPAGSMEKCVEDMRPCEELWVIGTRLGVYPAASLAPIAVQMGLSLIIVNQGETPYDRLATRLISAPIDEAIPEMVEERLKSAA